MTEQPTATNVPLPGPPPVPEEDFFGDLGLEQVPDQLADGKYPATFVGGNAGTYKKTVNGMEQTLRKVSFNWRVDWPQSQFHGEMVPDFRNIDPNENRSKRALRDRLQAIGVPMHGVGSADRLNALLASKKGAAVWIEVFTNKGGYLNVSSVATRDASLSGQMQQQAQAIASEVRDVISPTGGPRDY